MRQFMTVYTVNLDHPYITKHKCFFPFTASKAPQLLCMKRDQLQVKMRHITIYFPHNLSLFSIKFINVFLRLKQLLKLLQLRSDVALGVHQGLTTVPFLGHLVFMRIPNLQVITKDIVEADLQ